MECFRGGVSTVPRGDDMVCLNVGGKSFCTSRKTLLSAENTFFSGLLSGRHNSARDLSGAFFIDRDGTLFAVILNYLRTKKIDLRGESVHAVRDEAEYYGVMSLVKALVLVIEHENSSCGGILFNGYIDPPPASAGCPPLPGQENPVLFISGQQNYLAVAYRHYICVYKLVNAIGWDSVFTTPRLNLAPGQVALNIKVITSSGRRRLLAASSGGTTTVWDVTPADGDSYCITNHTFNAPVDVLFFIGTQLVVMSHFGEVAVWNAVTQQWKVQVMTPISSHATVNSTMLLGCANGSIYYIDMEKFPLRMKDNDLLVTQVYEDPAKEAITALSAYFTKSRNPANVNSSLEIAYGTANGNVRVIADHPETLGRGFQLLQTFTVHRSPITRVCLTEKYLVSVCSDFNHVRTWTVTRFRGNLSTQTFPAPLASFHVLALEMGNSADCESRGSSDIGPFSYHHKEQEDQVFIQRVAPVASELYCRLAASGQRVCVLRSVDESPVSAHCVVEFDASNRAASCERSFIFTGHVNGAVQMWDLTTAYELTRCDRGADQLRASLLDSGIESHCRSDGPSSKELLRALENFELRAADDRDDLASDRLSSTGSAGHRSLLVRLRKMHSPTPSQIYRVLSNDLSSVRSVSSQSSSMVGCRGSSVALTDDDDYYQVSAAAAMVTGQATLGVGLPPTSASRASAAPGEETASSSALFLSQRGITAQFPMPAPNTSPFGSLFSQSRPANQRALEPLPCSTIGNSHTGAASAGIATAAAATALSNTRDSAGAFMARVSCHPAAVGGGDGHHANADQASVDAGGLTASCCCSTVADSSSGVPSKRPSTVSWVIPSAQPSPSSADADAGRACASAAGLGSTTPTGAVAAAAGQGEGKRQVVAVLTRQTGDGVVKTVGDLFVSSQLAAPPGPRHSQPNIGVVHESTETSAPSSPPLASAGTPADAASKQNAHRRTKSAGNLMLHLFSSSSRRRGPASVRSSKSQENEVSEVPATSAGADGEEEREGAAATAPDTANLDHMLEPSYE